MSEIQYVIGDATAPVGDGYKFIVHCCNDIGAWGAGFVLALSKKWPRTRASYLEMFERGELKLGSVSCIVVEPDIVVLNLIGQHGILSANENPHPIRYDAIGKGLCIIRQLFKELHGKASLHMPRMGCGLAGGEWSRIEELINTVFLQTDYCVYVYDLTEKDKDKYGTEKS